MAVRNDPYTTYNFTVEIAGILDDPNAVTAGFSEVSGLDAELQTFAYRNGNEPFAAPRKVPGQYRYANVTLRRGVIGDLRLWVWLNDALSDENARATVTITLRNEAREAVLVWRLRRALPVKFTGPKLNASSGDIAMETLELCHEGIELTSP